MHVEQLFVARLRELAAFLERGDVGDELADLVIGHGQPADLCLLLKQASADQLVEDRIADFGVVENGRIEVALHRLPQTVLLDAQVVGELSLRNALAGDGRHLAGRTRVVAKIVIDAEERERKRDQRQDELD